MAHDEWDEATKAVSSMRDEPLAVEPEHEKAYLIVLTGNRLGTMVEVRDGMIIGRSHSVDFPLAGEGVSRQHARIRSAEDGKVLVEDLGSLNGTYVNNQRIESMALSDGDKIRIGSTTILKFSYADRLEEEFQQQLREAALHDPLTQIFNRRSLDDHLAREVAFADRHQTPLSLVLFDIDHFKNVNDTRGHPVGDEVLRRLSACLARQIRQEDILARYGGEEFALLCRGIAGSAALGVADRLRLTVASRPLVPMHPDLRITVSGGVAAMPASDISNTSELVDAADQALYRAKDLGRNRIVLHESPPLPRPGQK